MSLVSRFNRVHVNACRATTQLTPPPFRRPQETGWLMYRWWRFTPLFSLLTTIFISPLPLFVVFVVLTRDYALLRGSKQRSLQDSTDATREFHDT